MKALYCSLKVSFEAACTHAMVNDMRALKKLLGVKIFARVRSESEYKSKVLAYFEGFDAVKSQKVWL